MKLKALFLILIFSLSLIVGCTNNQTTPEPAPTQQPNPSNETPDAVTTASIVDNAEDFEKAISNTGTWIIAVTKDISTNKELVLDGEFKNGKKDDAGKDIIQRKIALYAQDSNRNITARYTLTAPKLTINSPEASIQHGTFKGDLYVSAKNFKLVDATVEGNVYFTNEDAQSTFSMDENSKITGTKGMAK
ncbi:hypothetical protein [Lutispora thermophila]|uniref:Polymer-forming protein n=1 Tax=Lutispora thermophila DSM 19022 TaxID=1122184 RepID=A0A1M6D843_9FIRM|nr:hypothetical protein [Lutispora thermophila]SHI69406.1 hypothetical protein SAMN02745176_01063 [Lutispora thermophila DSM 19022]